MKKEQYAIFEEEHTNRNKKRDRWFDALVNLLPENPVCAEVGVSVGVNSSRIIDTLKPKKFYMIDPWVFDDDHLDKKPVRHIYMKEFVYDKLSHISCVEIVEDYSYNVFSKFSDNYFDFVYIDGEHDYKNVMRDLECVFPKVKVGGLIAGHDYVNRHGVVPAVNKFIESKNIKKHLLPKIRSQLGCDGNSDFFFIKE